MVRGKIDGQPSSPNEVPNLPFLKKVLPISLYLRVVLLSQPSGLVSDDDCRFAVSVLNQYRWMRVENLEDGYHVSGTLYFDDIDSC